MTIYRQIVLLKRTRSGTAARGATSWQVLRTVAGGAATHLAIGGALGTVLGILFVQMRAPLGIKPAEALSAD
jgi:hypothetical protein